MNNFFLKVVLFFCVLSSFGQEKGVEISVSGGITTPLGDYKTEGMPSVTDNYGNLGGPYDFFGFDKKRKGLYYYNLDASYRFSKLGLGISIGSFNHEVSSIDYNTPFKTSKSGGELSGFYYGLGPNYNLKFSKIELALMLRAGMGNYNYSGFKAFYAGDDVPLPVEILETQLSPDAKTNMAYGSFALKLSYPISRRVSVFAKFDYLTTLGKGIAVNDSYYLPYDVDANNEINNFDVSHFTIIDLKREEKRYIKPQMLNVGIGLSYNLFSKKSSTDANQKDKESDYHNNQESKDDDKIVETDTEDGKNDDEKKNDDTDGINSDNDSGESDTENSDDNSSNEEEASEVEEDLNGKIYAGTNGEFEVTNDQSLSGLYSFTTGQPFSGTGTVYLPFVGITVQVEFQNIKVNNQAHLTVGKIVVKNNPDSPTFPKDWLLSSTGIGSLVNFNHDQVQNIMDWADDQSNAVPGLAYYGTNGPLQDLNNSSITTPFIMELDPNNDSRFALTEMVFLPTKSKFNAVVSFPTPADWNSPIEIGFIAKGVEFHPNTIANIQRAELVSDISIGNANNDISFSFKSTATPSDPNHPGCYIEWNDTGFQQFGIELEAQFTRDWFTPIPDDGTSRSKITLLGTATAWNDIIIQGDFEKSKIVNAHNMSIEATNLSLDMSDSLNPNNISFPAAYQNLPNAQTDATWRGFFAENVTVGLPDDIQSHQNGPIEIGVNQFIIDNQGLTMDVFANNVVQWPQANISDLNASIDAITAEIVTGTLISFQIDGKINIPTSSVNSIQNPLKYSAYYIPNSQVVNGIVTPQNLTLTSNQNSLAPNQSVLYLSISPDGPIYSSLLKGELELYPSSELYALKSGTLKYFDLKLHGVLKYDEVDLGALDDVIIELEFEDLGFTYDSRPNEGLEFNFGTWALASPQKKAHGFPLTINDIQYQSLPITGDEDLRGRINFDVLFNLSGNSSSISGASSLGIEFKIENDATNDKRFKPSYVTTHVDSIAVNANLPSVSIVGNLYRTSNDPIYGKRIGGSLDATFKGIDLSISAEGEFGTTTYNNNNNEYRYWRVEAGADFTNGIDFVSGLAFYGFKGGACRNMLLDVNTINPANITQTYVPDYGNFGFKAGATIGTKPLVEAFNADIEIEAIFSNTGGGMQYIALNGNFGTNATITDRRTGKGKVFGELLVEYDFPNKHFYLGANATINAPPITTPDPIWLALNIDGLQSKWFFKLGEPDYSRNSPNNLMNTVKVDLSSNGSGLSLYQYFMFGNDLPNVGGFTYRFKDSYADATGVSPSFGSNVGNISAGATTQLGTGMALGIGFGVDMEGEDKIMKNWFLKYDLSAGAEVNLSYMRYSGTCDGNNPVGINGWRAKGSLGVYASASASVERRKRYTDTWLIAELKGGAWMQGEFPNPYYVKGVLNGVARIGCIGNRCLLNRSVNVEFEKGTKCANTQNNSTPTYQQQYATDEFNNDLINHIAPNQNWNFPVDSPVAVKYNYVPNEEFHISEQQSNGSIINRTFKMVINSVRFVRATSVVNDTPQFSTNTMLAATNMGLNHRVNDIGEYQYILASLQMAVNQNALNVAIFNQSNQPVVQQAQFYPGMSAIVNPSGNISPPLNLTPIISTANFNYIAQAVIPISQYPSLPPYLNNLALNAYYKFTVETTMKEYNYNTSQWGNALNTDGSVVSESYIKKFRTGPMPPLTPIYLDNSILQQNLSTD